MPFETFPAC